TTLSPACAHAAIAMSWASTARGSSQALSGISPGPAITWSASAPAASPNGPTRYQANLSNSIRRRNRRAMVFPDLVPDLRARMPALRGRLMANQPLADLTWFRVGGPAQVLFVPEDEGALAYALGHLPSDLPVTVVGLGSNLIVRDGGVPGVVIRLGRGFGDIAVEGTRLRVGAAVPDVRVARAAQEAGVAGLAFMRGIPGA